MSKGGVHAVIQLMNYRHLSPPPFDDNQDGSFLQCDSDAETVRERGPTPEPMPAHNRRARIPKHVQKKHKKPKKGDRKTIIAYDLPLNLKRRDIVRMFRPFGKIRFLTIPLNEYLDTMGFAYILFKHKSSARNAISYKNYNVDLNSNLKVELKQTYIAKVARRRAKHRHFRDVTALFYRYELN